MSKNINIKSLPANKLDPQQSFLDAVSRNEILKDLFNSVPDSEFQIRYNDFEWKVWDSLLVGRFFNDINTLTVKCPYTGKLMFIPMNKDLNYPLLIQRLRSLTSNYNLN